MKILQYVGIGQCFFPGSMNTDDRLTVGESVFSKYRQVYLKLQTDGNLVMIRTDGDIAIWSSNTWRWGKKAIALIMQNDGNLVLYDVDDKPIWSTGTDRAYGAKFTLSDDESITVPKDGRLLWGRWTHGADLACEQTDGSKRN